MVLNKDKKDIKKWVIDIPDCHPSLNTWTRMHFHVRNNLKKEWETMTFYAAKEAKLPMILIPVEIFITYYHPKKNIDLDNYTPKFIIDGLKQFFVNDDFVHLTKLGWTFKQGKKRSVVEISLAV